MSIIGHTRRCLVILLAFIGSSVELTLAQETAATDTDQIDLKALWKRVVDVNRGWLDPQPKCLSYKISSGEPPFEPAETTQRVWISGENARWEMQDRDKSDGFGYTIVMSAERSAYVRGPQELLKQKLQRLSLSPMRQGLV